MEENLVVMHTHTRAGMAVAALEEGLLCLMNATAFFDDIAYHDYEDLAFTSMSANVWLDPWMASMR